MQTFPCYIIFCISKFCRIFFKKICGATDTHVLDFWWCLLWVSKPECSALITLGSSVCVMHSLRFTSGVTPANLLAASMAAEPISSTRLWADIGGTHNWDLSCHRQMIYRLSYTYLIQLTYSAYLILQNLLYLPIFTDHQWSCRKIIFSQVFVILSTGRG